MHVVLLGRAFPERPEAGVDRVHVRRACALAGRAAVTAVVPTPWAPHGIDGPGDRWARHRATPHHAEIDGIQLLFPRYLQVPGMGAWAGVTMALGAARTVRRLQREGRCDVLFAQTLLPEGLAAGLLGRWLGSPVACLGRGTDVHGLARSATTRRLARWTVRRATAIGVVANALAEALGAVDSAAPCTVLANGVDLQRFTPGSAVDARRTLGLNLQAPLALYVGRLAEGKGLDTLLDAFAALRALVPAARLVSWGPRRLRAHLERRVLTAGLAHAVRFAGEVPHHAGGDVDARRRRAGAAERGRRLSQRRARGARMRAPGRGDHGRRPAARGRAASRRPARGTCRPGGARLGHRARPFGTLGPGRDSRPGDRHDLGAQRRGDRALPRHRHQGTRHGRRGRRLLFSKGSDGRPTSDTQRRAGAGTGPIVSSRSSPRRDAHARARRAAATCAACCAASRAAARGPRQVETNLLGGSAPSSCRCRSPRPRRRP